MAIQYTIDPNMSINYVGNRQTIHCFIYKQKKFSLLHIQEKTKEIIEHYLHSVTMVT